MHVLVASGFPAAQAQPIILELPIDCRVGETCHVQNYVDQQGGPESRDFSCGHLTYHGHKGTDFRLPNLVRMRRGVAVRAAASGVVVGARNTMPDVNVRVAAQASLEGRECGNGVRLDHGEGWVTQYCHMRLGSVRVTPGERVSAGEVLGLVGLSGFTEFPHLHFEVEYRGMPMDPYVGKPAGTGCGTGGAPLWRPEVAGHLVYRPVGVINAGFAPRAPEMDEVEEGRTGTAAFSVTAPAFVFWVHTFGLRPEDEQTLTVRRPDGSVLVESRPEPVNRPKAEWLSYAGKRRPPDRAWPAGVYRGAYSLKRGGETLLSFERSIRVGRDSQ